MIEPGKLYRLCWTMDKPALRGVVVSVVSKLTPPYDIPRVHVRIVENDGSLGESWFVKESLLIGV